MLFSTREFPTTAIYFSESMADLIGDRFAPGKPIRRLSSNVFEINGARRTVVVIRNWDRTARRRIARMDDVELRYLLDDDIWAGIDHADLPERYRLKLKTLAEGAAREIISASTRVYVSTAPIAERISGAETVAASPALVEPVGDLDHHGRGPVRMLFAGTASHRGDLAAIADDLADVLRRHEDVWLYTFLGEHLPAALKLANVINRAPLSWQQYRKLMRRQRFHIALGPSLPTAFNAARSPNKILEYACFGAAPVFSAAYPHAERVQAAQSGLLVPMETGAWTEAIERLAAAPELALALAEANRDLALKAGDPARQRAFWLEELGL